MIPRGWQKIDEGWYTRDGVILQYWYRATWAPKGRPGWYIWNRDDVEPRGPFETADRAIAAVLDAG